MIASFVIDGPPCTKKNNPRIVTNRRTGKPFVLPSARSVAWQDSAAWQLIEQWRGRAPLSEPVEVSATFHRAARRGDLVNFMQALADALQHAGVLKDDRWIVSWDGSRLGHDPARPRVELTIRKA